MGKAPKWGEWEDGSWTLRSEAETSEGRNGGRGWTGLEKST